MVSYRIKASKNGYSLVEPLNDFHKSLGFLMVTNPNKEVLKFFTVDGNGLENARKYFDYISLTRYEKLKYWIHHKRGE